ncbi:MAG TPA: C1 family peptidase [Methanomassiliicoccales archaeon]
MKHGTPKILIMTLVLIILTSGINLIQGSIISDPSSSVRSDVPEDPDDPFDGIEVKYHLATEHDIEIMKERLIGNRYGAVSPTISGSGSVAPIGLSAMTAEHLDKLVGKIAVFDGYGEGPLPASPSTYDISSQPYFPEVRDQGVIGACAAFSVIYYNYGYLEALDNGWSDACLGNEEHLLSPGWAYNKVVVNGGGSIIADEALVAKTIGVCTWNLMPYDSSDYVDWGNEAAWRDAPSHRIDNVVYYPYSSVTTVDDIKRSLASNHPVTIAINATEISGSPAVAFEDGNFVLSSDEYLPSETDHSVTIVGYDDSITDDGDVGAFKAVNSWGTSFGNSGYFWITYRTMDAIGDLLQAVSMTDRIDYQPSSLAVYHFDWSPTYDAPITFSAVYNSNGTAVAEISPYLYSNSYAFMPSFMCQDISELSEYLMDEAYSIRMEVGDSYTGGTISSYRLEMYTEPYLDGRASEIGPEAQDLPVSTPAELTAQLPANTVVSPSEALSYFDGALTFAGGTQWVGVRNAQSREHVMQSGDVGDSSSSTLVAYVWGPGTLSFDWCVSSEPEFDYLSYYLEGSLVEKIDAETSWATVTTTVPSGIHELKWTYAKDEHTSSGSDCGWIDNITWDGRSTIMFEDFEALGRGDWFGEDSNPDSGTDGWNTSTMQSGSGRQSLWCSGSGIGWNGLPNLMNGYYDRNMNASVSVAIPDLSGVTDARLSFEYWAMTNGTDHAYARIYDGHGWSTVWIQPLDITEGWVREDMTIPVTAQALEFRFVSDDDLDIGYPGVFVDDIMVTVSDATPPSSWMSPLPTYITGSSIALTCTANDVGTGISYVQIYYREGTAGIYSLYATADHPSGRWTPGTIDFNLTELAIDDGLYQFYSIATDRPGNQEPVPASADASTILDGSAPTTVMTMSGIASPGWNNGPVMVTLTGTDRTSGVLSTSYRIGSEPWTAYSGPFECSIPGIYLVQYYSTDRAGNAGSMEVATIQIDGQKPASSATVHGVTGDGGWFVSNTTLSISAADGLSGIQNIEYSLDGDVWKTYSGSVNITGQGDHTVQFMATDMAGNREDIGSTTFRIDREAPVSTCTVTGPGDPTQMMFNDTVNVTLAAQDPVSGLSLVQYTLDGGAWTEYSDRLTIANIGYHILSYRSLDQAGNSEVQRWANFTVDRTAPSSSAMIDAGQGTAGWYVGNVTIVLNASDPGSGVGGTYYCWLQGAVNGPSWIRYSGPITVTEEGALSLAYRTVDRSLNAEPVRYLNLSVDRNAPNSVVVLNGVSGTNGWFTGTVMASVSVNDSGSGVSTKGYRLDGGDWTDDDYPFVISGDGNHTIEVLSIDNAGNEEQIKTFMVRIDSVKPTAELSMKNGTVVNGTSVLVNLTVGDEGSGILTKVYRIDGQGYAPISGNSIRLSDLKNGHHLLTIEVTDGAGNALVKEIGFEVDAKNTGSPTDLALIAISMIGGSAVVAAFLLIRRHRKI